MSELANEELLTIEDAAKLVGISVSVARECIRSGEWSFIQTFPSSRGAAFIRVPRGPLVQWVYSIPSQYCEGPQKITGVIYLMETQGFYKIGLSVDVRARLRTVQAHNPMTVNLVHTITTQDARLDEQRLHQKFTAKRMHGEWFNLTPEDVAWICAINSFNDEGTP